MAEKRKTPNGAPFRFIQEVAIPYQGMECLIWPFNKVGRGYGQLRVDGTANYAHRYVCLAIKGAPPSDCHEAAHSCGNKACVNPNHLRWATPKENCQDKVAQLSTNRGERHGSAKLTEAQVKEILALAGKKKQVSIAKLYGVTPQTISSILSGKTWGWSRLATCANQ